MNIAILLQDAGAEEQSAELFRYVPPEIGVYTNNTHEEVPDSSLTKVCHYEHGFNIM